MNLFLSLIFVLTVSLVNAEIYYDSSNDDYNEVKNSRNFTGKVVLVTGSTSGLGEEIVKLFSALGAQVVVTGRKAEAVKNISLEVQQLSPQKLKPLGVVADVTKSDDLSRLLSETIKTFGKLDVLVNNAGIGFSSNIFDPKFMPIFDQTIATNLRAYVELSHLSVPYLEETNGTIICISSGAALKPSLNSTAYSVSKAGVDMMAKVLALELGPKIRVNTINPGPIQTNIMSYYPPDFLKRMISLTPLKRMGIPLDIAKGVAFLASTDAQFITGIELVIDGGIRYTMGDSSQ